MDIKYQIISSGSKGNAVVLNDSVLIDCGVSYKALSPYIKTLQLVLLTHRHFDHFKASTIKKMATERPGLRFACGSWMQWLLLDAGVNPKNIDIMDFGYVYPYRICNVEPVPLSHDVPNCGWKIHFPTGKVFYATDTANLNGIKATGYDLYLVEANHEETEIQARIDAKREVGQYAYEVRASQYHLSEQQCMDFILKNRKPTSEYVYMHRHEDRVCKAGS